MSDVTAPTEGSAAPEGTAHVETVVMDTEYLIDCPRCQVTMEKVLFDEFQVDRCPQCLGIWFDMLEQDQLKKLPGAETIDVGAETATPNEEGRLLNCPKCRVRMYITRDPQQGHIVYEKCNVCYGVYFDAGEFTDFKNITFMEYLKNLFNS
jgi:uncharacterized protein